MRFPSATVSVICVSSGPPASVVDERAERRAALLSKLESGQVDVNQADAASGMTAFGEAVLRGDQELVEACLKLAAPDVDGLSNAAVNASPPLFLAERANSAALVRLLIQAGADVDRWAFGRTCLHMAVGNNRLQIVQCLLAAGASVDAADQASGRTALHIAAWFGFVDVALCLLAFGADPNARNLVSQTPLMRTDSHAVAVTLICAGADVDSQVELDGASVVQAAVRNARVPLLRALIVCGADVNVVNKRGKAPIEYADASVVPLLYAAGAAQRTCAIAPAAVAADVAAAARLLAHMQLDLIRERATDVCVGLQELELPAYVTLQIVDAACEPLANCVALHVKWALVTAVKHWHERRANRNAALHAQLRLAAESRQGGEDEILRLQSQGIT